MSENKVEGEAQAASGSATVSLPCIYGVKAGMTRVYNEEGRSIPVTALEPDLAVDDVEEAGPAKGERAAVAHAAGKLPAPRSSARPFEGRPGAFLEQSLDLREGVGEGTEELLKALPNCTLTDHRIAQRDLQVRRVVVIERRSSGRISAIERVDPRQDNIPRSRHPHSLRDPHSTPCGAAPSIAQAVPAGFARHPSGLCSPVAPERRAG